MNRFTRLFQSKLSRLYNENQKLEQEVVKFLDKYPRLNYDGHIRMFWYNCRCGRVFKLTMDSMQDQQLFSIHCLDCGKSVGDYVSQGDWDDWMVLRRKHAQVGMDLYCEALKTRIRDKVLSCCGR